MVDASVSRSKATAAIASNIMAEPSSETKQLKDF
jgi:hypothetical protein